MALKFKDIKDWKPSTISIVDQPSHPMAVFEVYEDDEEFVKKYITPEDEVEVMTKEDSEKNVQMSEGFFEKLINGLVAKSEPQESTEPPAQKTPTKSETMEDENKILEAIGKIDNRLDSMEARITKLEGGEKPPEPKVDDPVPGAVKKSEEKEPEEDGEVKVDPTITDEGTVNPEATVSKSIDPDLAKGNASEKSFLERMGRKSNGMAW